MTAPRCRICSDGDRALLSNGPQSKSIASRGRYVAGMLGGVLQFRAQFGPWAQGL